jgi:hypothetical protein
MEDLKWEKFELRVFVQNYNYTKKTNIVDIQNDFQNDFELRYKKTLPTRFECEYLIYHYEEPKIEGENGKRYAFHKGEHLNGEESLPPYLTERYEEIKTKNKQDYLNVFGTNQNDEGNINMSEKIKEIQSNLAKAVESHKANVDKLSKAINPDTGSLSLDIKTFDKYRNNVKNSVNNIVYFELAKIIEEKKSDAGSLTFKDYHLFDFLESAYNAIQINPEVMKEFRKKLSEKDAGSITYNGSELPVEPVDKVWKISGRKTKIPNWLREPLLNASILFKNGGGWNAELDKIFSDESNFTINPIDEKDRSRKKITDEKTGLTDGLVKFGAKKLTKRG